MYSSAGKTPSLCRLSIGSKVAQAKQHHFMQIYGKLVGCSEIWWGHHEDYVGKWRVHGDMICSRILWDISNNNGGLFVIIMGTINTDHKSEWRENWQYSCVLSCGILEPDIDGYNGFLNGGIPAPKYWQWDTMRSSKFHRGLTPGIHFVAAIVKGIGRKV